MAQYYFISQLPSLDGISDNMPLPITEQRFYELCESFLGKKEKAEIENLTLLPQKEPQSCDSALINAWNDGERALRMALGKVRAEKMKKSFDTQHTLIPVELVKAANTAAEFDNPMEAERFLNKYRLAFLETLRPMDSFSKDYIYYYGLKLKLILRIRLFDTAAGASEYRNIYNSVLDGDGLEVV